MQIKNVTLDPAVFSGHRTAVVRLAPPPLPARKDRPAPEVAAEPVAAAADAVSVEAAPADVAPTDAASADAAAPAAGAPKWPQLLLHCRREKKKEKKKKKID